MTRYGKGLAHGAGAFALGYSIAALISACSAAPPITPADLTDIAATSEKTANCKAQGRASGSYSVYNCCMVVAGLHSGAMCPAYMRDAAGTTPQDAGPSPADASKEASDAAE